jgi:hypothetical protein
MESGKGILNDHAGKRSNSRAVSWVATLVLSAIALGVVFKAGTEEPSMYLLSALVALAIGPIGMNRYFGEKGTKTDG